VLDACVLYPATLRNVLLSLAHEGLFHARWTMAIEEEWTRTLLANRPDLTSAQLRRVQSLMNHAIPDCQITGFESLIPSLHLPDANDRHVLAAAIAGHASIIVTSNLRDFPADILSRHGIVAQHPDEFVVNRIDQHESDALTAFRHMRERLRDPAMSGESFVRMIEDCGLLHTAQRLRACIEQI